MQSMTYSILSVFQASSLLFYTTKNFLLTCESISDTFVFNTITATSTHKENTTMKLGLFEVQIIGEDNQPIQEGGGTLG